MRQSIKQFTTLRTRREKVFFSRERVSKGIFLYVLSLRSSRLFVFWPRIMPKMSQNKSDLSTFLPRRISSFFLQKYIVILQWWIIWKILDLVKNISLCTMAKGKSFQLYEDIIEHILMKSNQEKLQCIYFIFSFAFFFWGYTGSSSNGIVQFAKNLHIWKRCKICLKDLEGRVFFNALFCDYNHDILLLTFCKRNCTKILTF